MAEKKTVSVKPAAKAVAATKAATEKAVEVKKEVVAEVKEAAKEVKAPAKKATAEKKEAVKKAPAKKATAEKKETVKKAPAAKKETVKKVAKAAVVTLEYKGNAYTEASLVQSAKDVWVYDLGKDLKDFKSVELYVKPEENTVYYVINKEVTGGFAL